MYEAQARMATDDRKSTSLETDMRVFHTQMSTTPFFAVHVPPRVVSSHTDRRVAVMHIYMYLSRYKTYIMRSTYQKNETSRHPDRIFRWRNRLQ